MIREFRGYQLAQIDQYFGIWAMRLDIFRAAVERANRMDLQQHIGESLAAGGMDGASTARGPAYEVLPGGIAVIDLSGPLMKFSSSMSPGASTVDARRQVRDAAANSAVAGIVLRIDSPGGTVSGTQDLADDVAAAAKIKPVEAYIEDQAASAAYWIASQTSLITSNASALIGGIGTYASLVDSAGAAEKQGFRVHVISSGGFKGMGSPGTEITPEHLAEVQRLVDGLNQQFLAAVSSGRNMPPAAVAALADGRVHIAADAMALGLINAVGSFADVVNRMRSIKAPVSKNQTQAKGNTMSIRAEDAPPPAETEEEKKKRLADEEAKKNAAPSGSAPATIHDLKAVCVGADDKFIVSQLAGNATLDQARTAWMHEMNSRMTAQQTENAALKAVKPGVPQLNAGGKPTGADSDDGSAAAQWHAAIDAKVRPGVTRQQAAVLVAKENPALQAQYIDEYRAAAARR